MATVNPTRSVLPHVSDAPVDSEEFPGKRSMRPPLWWPLVAWFGALAACQCCDLDLRTSAWFVGNSAAPWPLHRVPAWLWFDRLATLPGLILGCLGIALVVASGLDRSFVRHRRLGLFLALSLALGPGLVVNLGFKTLWGRPRPYQLTEFGGHLEHKPVWSPDELRYNSSFPSGHASLGFFLMVPALAAWHRPREARFWLALGLTAGAAIGASRVVQGRHFVTDVIGSVGIVYFSALAVFCTLGFMRLPIERSLGFHRALGNLISAGGDLATKSTAPKRI